LKRNFITNLAFLLLLNLLIKPVYAFGVDVGVQNAVGAQGYGNYFILLNFSLIFQIILDLGIENFTRREIARHSHLLDKYLSTILPLKIILGGIYFGVCAAIGLFLGWELHEFRLLFVLLLNQFLASFILYFRANLGGLHMFRTDSIISVLDKLIVILICGFLLLYPVTRNAFRIEWLIYAQTLAYLTVAMISFSLVYKNTARIIIRFNIRYYILLLRNSLPYALLILLMATYLRIDSVLLGKLLDNGKEQAGIYAQSFRIVEIFSNYGYLFTVILLPVFSRLIRQGKSVEHLTRLSFSLLFVPAIILTFVCLYYRGEIIRLLYHEHIVESSRVFGILIFSFLGICMTYIFGTLLTANGNIRILNTMALMAVALNLGLNFLLIKRFAVLGAAYASMATQLFTSGYQVFMVKQIFKFKTSIRFLIRLGIFCTMTGLAGALFAGLEINWIYSLLMFLSVAGLLSFVTGLFNLKAIRGLFITAELG
jgi:O-antigen/teichoic acid export membrane protein